MTASDRHQVSYLHMRDYRISRSFETAAAAQEFVDVNALVCPLPAARLVPGAHGGAGVIAEHIVTFVKRFRREWGAEPTALLAVGFTRQQQAPKPHYPASDQYAAYCAMAYLRTIGRDQ